MMCSTYIILFYFVLFCCDYAMLYYNKTTIFVTFLTVFSNIGKNA